MNTPKVSFDAPEEVGSLISEVVERVKRQERDDWSKDALLQLRMSLTACHANGCPIDWSRLLEADNFNFYHDVFGIHRRISTSTGELGGYFLPRFALPQGAQS